MTVNLQVLSVNLQMVSANSQIRSANVFSYCIDAKTHRTIKIILFYSLWKAGVLPEAINCSSPPVNFIDKPILLLTILISEI